MAVIAFLRLKQQVTNKSRWILIEFNFIIYIKFLFFNILKLIPENIEKEIPYRTNFDVKYWRSRVANSQGKGLDDTVLDNK